VTEEKKKVLLFSKIYFP
jgi:hypothetical protein